MPGQVRYGIARKQLSLRTAAAIVVLLWLAYTVIYTLHPTDELAAALEFIPGILGLGTLALAGFSRDECFLRAAPISRTGLALLGVFFIFLTPILLTGEWSGWNWKSALVFAPASGISQELFFRATLMPTLLKVLGGRTLLAVTVHSVLFAAWHMPVAFTTAPIAGAVAVILVTFIGGMIWGWQVQRDRTVAWAMGQHVLYLIAMSLFVWE